MTIKIPSELSRATCLISLSDRTTYSTATKYKWSSRLEVINLTDKVALYNFLSTFSGTHYVTPRTVTGTISLHF